MLLHILRLNISCFKVYILDAFPFVSIKLADERLSYYMCVAFFFFLIWTVNFNWDRH